MCETILDKFDVDIVVITINYLNYFIFIISILIVSFLFF